MYTPHGDDVFIKSNKSSFWRECTLFSCPMCGIFTYGQHMEWHDDVFVSIWWYMQYCVENSKLDFDLGMKGRAIKDFSSYLSARTFHRSHLKQAFCILQLVNILNLLYRTMCIIIVQVQIRAKLCRDSILNRVGCSLIFEASCISLTLMNYLCTSRKLNVSCNLK